MFFFKETKKYTQIQYAFFSRKNGVSKGIYNSLNCGMSSKDKKGNVQKNRIIALKKIGLDNKKLIIPNQIHSNKVRIVNNDSKNKQINADGLITKSEKIVLGILTADCAPVFFFDYKKSIISAIHAGWRGAKNDIIYNTIKLMLECGSKLNNIVSCIGPCIGKESYLINNDFYNKFVIENSKNKRFFLIKNNKMKFDLKSYIVEKIKKSGVKKIYFSSFDTFKDKKNFFSYRRSLIYKEKDYGRCLSIISLNGK
ncbi:MAG: Laccase domain protein YfiH [Alphaproteobacteria bacterium MarineAlpha6_Bin4]|nr:MAG: Laccase domain protein YfiH [Alphaproteobacteria bacterium MarineAlpha6_Bin3]PPR37378.1 MAG: Laccase domain protein YfiH [Alphaproteobacteria bacterium MarineAlpha6_Bin4]